MLNFTIRRLVMAVPTVIIISLLIFLLLDLAPGDPTAQLPLTIPLEVRDEIRLALGLGDPVIVRYFKWLQMMLVNEPLHALEQVTGWNVAPDTQRILSWQSRSPVGDIIAQRIPQTLWVVGMGYLFGILIALPIGIISAYKQYSWFDQLGTFIAMVGFSVPVFFTGVVLILVFSVWLGWFPSMYDTTLRVTDWDSFMRQVRQMVLPVSVLALFNAAQISRFMRASMLDNLNMDYVRTARAKGLRERTVVMVHVLRNSMIPVVTVIALGVPSVFSGAIITETIFRVNGLGALLINAIYANDIPMIQTLTFIFAVLIVLFNLIADVIYGILDPRIRYD
ncbi:ABC transporter permease [Rhodobaculum claviforme]|uniref:ABC transporter substrate-binding protein n=1 Tax=Rhodobaculum claviforme TaxID=1549854 RepID=A0A934TJS9_9RHOB|nr:ABC transporter permease [Rhodobaculum claviforme]MBK5927455.1 ABC transporter substrate-binding protein [Rhodobaculum claviforme]